MSVYHKLTPPTSGNLFWDTLYVYNRSIQCQKNIELDAESCYLMTCPVSVCPLTTCQSDNSAKNCEKLTTYVDRRYKTMFSNTRNFLLLLHFLKF